MHLVAELRFPYFRMGVEWIAGEFYSAFFILFMFAFLAIVYMICSLIDAVRALSWMLFSSKLK